MVEKVPGIALLDVGDLQVGPRQLRNLILREKYKILPTLCSL